MADCIDDMMKTAGVKAKEDKYCYWECRKPELKNIACKNTKCPYYKHIKYPLPEFTPGKQLEIIKLIGASYECKNFQYSQNFYDDNYLFYVESFGNNSSVCSVSSDFAQGLASTVELLIRKKCLDKQKVKEILEK